jgi:UDP-N-acetylmuramoyl-tripeptide--D-alanyl-D-alanine ligase
MTVAEVIDRLHGTPLALGEQQVRGFSIDSRTLQPGDVFFAVAGERHDGHTFAGAALDRGASAVVVSRPLPELPADRQIQVADTLAALQELAARLLAEWGGPVIGVTGSTGKTTTKDLTAAVLQAAGGATHKSAGNLNNAYGLPLSVLEMVAAGHCLAEYHYAVFEMGMSTPGEIRRLTEIAPPTVGIITNVSPVHLEFFADGIDGIARAKAELVHGLKTGGYAVLNADDPRVAAMAALRSDVRVMTYGLSEPADVTASNLAADGLRGTRFRLRSPAGSAEVLLPLVGRHNVANALAAVTAALALGLSLEPVVAALNVATPLKMRGQVLKLGNSATVVDDSYNSNPRALKEMVSVLAGFRAAGRRIVVAGEMLELGPASADLHRDSGRAAAVAGVDLLIGVRGDARAMVEGAREAGMGDAAQFVETPEEATERLVDLIRSGDVVLVKGSRGVATERVVAGLVKTFGGGGAG